MNLAGGDPNFASFAKSGDKIANLATLWTRDPVRSTKQSVIWLNVTQGKGSLAITMARRISDGTNVVFVSIQ